MEGPHHQNNQELSQEILSQSSKMLAKITSTFYQTLEKSEQMNKEHIGKQTIISTGVVISPNLIITCASNIYHDKIADEISIQLICSKTGQVKHQTKHKHYFIPQEYFSPDKENKIKYDYALLQFGSQEDIKQEELMPINYYNGSLQGKQLLIINYQLDKQKKVQLQKKFIIKVKSQKNQLLQFNKENINAVPGSPIFIRNSQSKYQFVGITLKSTEQNGYGLLLNNSKTLFNIIKFSPLNIKYLYEQTLIKCIIDQNYKQFFTQQSQNTKNTSILTLNTLNTRYLNVVNTFQKAFSLIQLNNTNLLSEKMSENKLLLTFSKILTKDDNKITLINLNSNLDLSMKYNAKQIQKYQAIIKHSKIIIIQTDLQDLQNYQLANECYTKLFKNAQKIIILVRNIRQNEIILVQDYVHGLQNIDKTKLNIWISYQNSEREKNQREIMEKFRNTFQSLIKQNEQQMNKSRKGNELSASGQTKTHQNNEQNKQNNKNNIKKLSSDGNKRLKQKVVQFYNKNNKLLVVNKENIQENKLNLSIKDKYIGIKGGQKNQLVNNMNNLQFDVIKFGSDYFIYEAIRNIIINEIQSNESLIQSIDKPNQEQSGDNSNQKQIEKNINQNKLKQQNIQRSLLQNKQNKIKRLQKVQDLTNEFIKDYFYNNNGDFNHNSQEILMSNNQNIILQAYKKYKMYNRIFVFDNQDWYDLCVKYFNNINNNLTDQNDYNKKFRNSPAYKSSTEQQKDYYYNSIQSISFKRVNNITEVKPPGYLIYNSNKYFTSYVNIQKLALSQQQCFQFYIKADMQNTAKGYLQSKVKNQSLNLKNIFISYQKCLSTKLLERNTKSQIVYKQRSFANGRIQSNKIESKIMQTMLGVDNLTMNTLMKFHLPSTAWAKYGIPEYGECPYNWNHIQSRCFGGQYSIKNGYIGTQAFNKTTQIYQSLGQTLFTIQDKLKNKYIIPPCRLHYNISGPCIKEQNKFFKWIYSYYLACSQITLKLSNQIEVGNELIFQQIVNYSFNPFSSVRPLIFQKFVFEQLYKIDYKIPQIKKYYKSDNKEQHKLSDYNQQNLLWRDNIYRKNKNYVSEYIKNDNGKSFLDIFGNIIPCSIFQSNKQDKIQDSYQAFSVQIPFNHKIFEKLFTSNFFNLIPKTIISPNLILQSNQSSDKLQSNFEGKITFAISQNFVGIMTMIQFSCQLDQTFNKYLQSIFGFQGKSKLILSGGAIFSSNLFTNPQLPMSIILTAELSDGQQFNQLLQSEDIQKSFKFNRIGLKISIPFNQNSQVSVSLYANMEIRNLSANPIKLNSVILYRQGSLTLIAETQDQVKQFGGLKSLTVKNFRVECTLGSENSIDVEFTVMISNITLQFQGRVNKDSFQIDCQIDDLTKQNLFDIVEYFTGKRFSTNCDFKFNSIRFAISYDRIKKDINLLFKCDAKIDQFQFGSSIEYIDGLLKFNGSANKITFTQSIILQKPSFACQIPIKSQKPFEFDLQGQLHILTFSGIPQIVLNGQLGVQYGKSFEYQVQLGVKIQQFGDTLSQLKNIIPINQLKYYYRSLKYIPSNMKNMQRTNCLILLFNSVKLTDTKTLSIEAEIDFFNRSLKAIGDFENNENPNDVISLKSFQIGLFLGKGVKFGLKVICTSPKYKQTIRELIGELQFEFAPVFQIKITLAMTGYIQICDDIIFGYKNDDREKSKISLGVSGEAISAFGLKGRIQIGDFSIQGDVQYNDFKLERLYFETKSLNMTEVLKMFLKLCKISIGFDLPLFVINTLMLDVNLVPKNQSFKFELDITAFNKPFTIHVQVIPIQKKFLFFQKIGFPINLYGVIQLAQSKGSSSGPLIDILVSQNDRQKNHVIVKGYVKFFIFEVEVDITLLERYFKFKFELSIFSSKLSIDIEYQDNQKQKYIAGSFSLKLSNGQMAKVHNDVEDKYKGACQQQRNNNTLKRLNGQNNHKMNEQKNGMRQRQQFEQQFNLLYHQYQQKLSDKIKLKRQQYLDQKINRKQQIDQCKSYYEQNKQLNDTYKQQRAQLDKRIKQNKTKLKFTQNNIKFNNQKLKQNKNSFLNNFRQHINLVNKDLIQDKQFLQNQMKQLNLSISQLHNKHQKQSNNFKLLHHQKLSAINLSKVKAQNIRQNKSQFKNIHKLLKQYNNSLKGCLDDILSVVGKCVCWVGRQILDGLQCLWNEVSTAFSTLWKQLKTMVLDIKYMEIYGSDHYDRKTGKHSLAFGFILKAVFLGSINIDMNVPFRASITAKNPQLVNEQIMITMVNITLNYYKSFYIIPRPIFNSNKQNILNRIKANQPIYGLSLIQCQQIKNIFNLNPYGKNWNVVSNKLNIFQQKKIQCEYFDQKQIKDLQEKNFYPHNDIWAKPIVYNEDKIQLGECKKVSLYSSPKITSKDNQFLFSMYDDKYKVFNFLQRRYYQYDQAAGRQGVSMIQFKFKSCKFMRGFYNQNYNSKTQQIIPITTISNQIQVFENQKNMLKDLQINDIQINKQKTRSQYWEWNHTQYNKNITDYIKDDADGSIHGRYLYMLQNDELKKRIINDLNIQKNIFNGVVKSLDEVKKLYLWRIQYEKIEGQLYAKLSIQMNQQNNKFYLACSNNCHWYGNDPTDKQVYLIKSDIYDQMSAHDRDNIYWKLIDSSQNKQEPKLMVKIPQIAPDPRYLSTKWY